MDICDLCGPGLDCTEETYEEKLSDSVEPRTNCVCFGLTLTLHIVKMQCCQYQLLLAECQSQGKARKVRELRIPAAEGYGENGFPAWGIPPKAELEFELEVLSIKRKGGGKKTDDLRL